MDYIAQPKDYWIAPNAIHISLNALGDANRIQCSVASGAVIMCYIYGTNNDNLGYDNGHQYRTWPIVIAPTYFNTNTQKYVYVAIPKNQTVGTTAMVVFPSEQLDIYGKNSSNEQIGSTDYFFIWLQGIISEVQEASSTTERQWSQNINYGLLDTDQARDAKIDDTSWYSYSHLTEIVTFLKEIVMNVGSSFRNIFLGPNGGKELTSVATDETTPTNSTTAVATPAYINGRWLRKDINDTSPGVPTFENGIKAGDWSEGVSGSCLWQDGEGGWHFEADFVNIRKKLTAAEVAIQDVHHVGGQMLLTAASCTADFVQDMGTFYRCYFRRKDDDGKEVRNQWRVGDQAYCRTFNLEKQENGMIGNHYFWRLVTGVSSNNSYDIAFPDFHYVDLSKGTCDYGSDAPRAGDDIVQLGYRGTDNAGRQTAILIAGAAADDSSPFIRLFEGISSFSLPANPEQIKPGDNRLKGVLRIMEGSTLEDGRDINNLGTHRGNMLRNTGFTGDYESVLVDGMTEVEGDTPIYSDPLYQWDYRGTEVWDDPDSASGKSAHVGYLSQVVAGGMTAGAWYVLSFSVRGSCTVTAGTLSKVVGTEAWQRIDWPFIYNGTDNRISFNGEADIREVMLTAGTLPCEWRRAAGDNDKSMAEYFGMEYLRNAISEASTTVLGGLILSQIIKVGNYRDGLMTEETGGMSGARNDGQSPYLWGGGTMEQAIYTIAKYATDPTYQPTRAELSNMAQFVVTHGGRAILNDVILRGYIYALGGVFNGTVYASDGEFSGTVHANAGDFSGEENLFKILLSADQRNIKISGPTLVDGNDQPISGATQADYMVIGGWLKRANIGGQGYRITPVIASRSLGADLNTAIQMNLSAVGGLHFKNGQDGDMAIYGATDAHLPSIVLAADLPTSSADISVGQLWNDNGTIKIKQ